MTDSAGAQIDTTMKYLPFGGTRSGSVPTDKKFTGQRLDATGLYYYNARYYDPTIGRFISPDTVIPDPANPQCFNRYSYCLNNPLKYTDPSGKDPYVELLVMQAKIKNGDKVDPHKIKVKISELTEQVTGAYFIPFVVSAGLDMDAYRSDFETMFENENGALYHSEQGVFKVKAATNLIITEEQFVKMTQQGYTYSDFIALADAIYFKRNGRLGDTYIIESFVDTVKQKQGLDGSLIPSSELLFPNIDTLDWTKLFTPYFTSDMFFRYFATNFSPSALPFYVPPTSVFGWPKPFPN